VALWLLIGVACSDTTEGVQGVNLADDWPCYPNQKVDCLNLTKHSNSEEPGQLRCKVLRLLMSSMADVDVLEDDRDTSLPSSALSPTEYRSFRGLVSELGHKGDNNGVPLYNVIEFLATFRGVTHGIAQQVSHLYSSANGRSSKLCLEQNKVSLLGMATYSP
jgi:hypothetical protein